MPQSNDHDPSTRCSVALFESDIAEARIRVDYFLKQTFKEDADYASRQESVANEIINKIEEVATALNHDTQKSLFARAYSFAASHNCAIICTKINRYASASGYGDLAL